MSRRFVWGGVALAVIMVLCSVWFMQNFERVETTRREAPQREARRNPYLALERFCARLQRPLSNTSNPQVLDALPTPGVLILDRSRSRHVGKARSDEIMRWVENGGYLIVVPEAGLIPDSIVDRFDLRWAEPRASHEDKTEPAGTDSDAQAPQRPDATAPVAPKLAPPPERVSVRIPGAVRPLEVSFSFGLEPGKLAPEWQAASPPYGASIMHFAYGRGNVTVISQLAQIASNDTIGQHDHAELMWSLLSRYQPHGPITLLTRVHVPTLWEWLADTAWMVLISAAALIALWLLRIVPPFGVARVPAPAEHRELREHLGAIGRFVWRAGGLSDWLDVARRAFHARLALRHPAIAALPREQLTQALANMSARPHTAIVHALESDARTPLQFTEALRTLQRLERSL
jgi:uncharacterized protein DUF4350